MPVGTSVSITPDTISATISFSRPGLYNVICSCNGSVAVNGTASQAPRYTSFVQVAFVGVGEDSHCNAGATSGPLSERDAALLVSAAAATLSRSSEVLAAMAASTAAVPRSQAAIDALAAEYRDGSRSHILGGTATRFVQRYVSDNKPIVGAILLDADGIAVAAHPLPPTNAMADAPPVAAARGGATYVGELGYELGLGLTAVACAQVSIGPHTGYLVLALNRTIPRAPVHWMGPHGRLARPVAELPVQLVRAPSRWRDIMRAIAPLLGEWTGGQRVARAFTAVIDPPAAAALGYGELDVAAEQMALARAREYRDGVLRARWAALGVANAPPQPLSGSYYLESGCAGSPTGFCLVEEVSIGLTAAELAHAVTSSHTLGWLLRVRPDDVGTHQAVLQPDIDCTSCGYGAVWHVLTPVAVEGGAYVLRDTSPQAFATLDRKVGVSPFAAGASQARTALAAGPSEGDGDDGAIVVDARSPSVDARVSGPEGDARVSGRDAATAGYVLTSLPTPDSPLVLPSVDFNASYMRVRPLHCGAHIAVGVHFVEPLTTAVLLSRPGFSTLADPRDGAGGASVFTEATCVDAACAAAHTPHAAVGGVTGLVGAKASQRSATAVDASATRAGDGGAGDGAGAGDGDGDVAVAWRGAHVATHVAGPSIITTPTPASTPDDDLGAYAALYRETEVVTIRAPDIVVPPSAAALAYVLATNHLAYVAAFPPVLQEIRVANAAAATRSPTELAAAASAVATDRVRVLASRLLSGTLQPLLDGASPRICDAIAIYDKDGLVIGAHPLASRLPVQQTVANTRTADAGAAVLLSTRESVDAAASPAALAPFLGGQSAVGHYPQVGVVRVQMLLRFDLPTGNATVVYVSDGRAPTNDTIYAMVELRTLFSEMHTYTLAGGRTAALPLGAPLALAVGRYDVQHSYRFGVGTLQEGTYGYRIAVIDCGSGTLHPDGTCSHDNSTLVIVVSLVGFLVAVAVMGALACVVRLFFRYRVQRAKYDQLPRPTSTDHADTDDDDDNHHDHAAADKSASGDGMGATLVASAMVKASSTVPRCYAMFTDIEGSTQLWQQHSPLMEEAVQEHHRLIRARCAKHQGIEVNSQGDSFFFVFHTAGECVEACVMIQLDLLTAKWKSRLLRLPLLAPSTDMDADHSAEEPASQEKIASLMAGPAAAPAKPSKRKTLPMPSAFEQPSVSSSLAPYNNLRGSPSVGSQWTNVPVTTGQTGSGSQVNTPRSTLQKDKVTFGGPTNTIGEFELDQAVLAQSTLSFASSESGADRAGTFPLLRGGSGFGASSAVVVAVASPVEPLSSAAISYPALLPNDSAALGGTRSQNSIHVGDDDGWPRGGQPRVHATPAPSRKPAMTIFSAASPPSTAAAPAVNVLSFNPPPPHGSPMERTTSPTFSPGSLPPAPQSVVVHESDPSDSAADMGFCKMDSRRRYHPAASSPVRSQLPAGEQTLLDYSTPPLSWRGLRVRIGASPLCNARLHLFGLQSFREYLSSCGASHKGSALAFDYVGPDVNRAARIAGAARGGEVIMPATMMDLLPKDIRSKLSFVPMGGVFLKGIGNSGELASILPRGLGRSFTMQAATTHCDRCYGLLSCAACEADEGRLGEWIGAVE